MTAVPESIGIPYRCSVQPIKKCSATTIPKSFVCINCGNAFHSGCVKRMNNVVYVKGYLIKCCRVNSMKVNSNNDTLNNEITDLKSQILNYNKTIEGLTSELDNLKTCNNNLNDEIKLIKANNEKLSDDISINNRSV